MGAAIYRKDNSGNFQRVRKCRGKSASWNKTGKASIFEYIASAPVEITETMSTPQYMWKNGIEICSVHTLINSSGCTIYFWRNATQFLSRTENASGEIISGPSIHNINGGSTVEVTVIDHWWYLNFYHENGALITTVETYYGPVYLTLLENVLGAGRRVNV